MCVSAAVDAVAVEQRVQAVEEVVSVCVSVALAEPETALELEAELEFVVSVVREMGLVVLAARVMGLAVSVALESMAAVLVGLELGSAVWAVLETELVALAEQALEGAAWVPLISSASPRSPSTR